LLAGDQQVRHRDLDAREIAMVFQSAALSRRASNPLDRGAYVDAAALAGIEYECATAQGGR
jgi:hypothetical protein